MGSDIWIYLLQSGLKLKFDRASQLLNLVEVFLMQRDDAPFTMKVQWSLKGQALLGGALSLQGIEQIMYQATKPPQITDNGLAILSYDSGAKFIFQNGEAKQDEIQSMHLAKVLIMRPIN